LEAADNPHCDGEGGAMLLKAMSPAADVFSFGVLLWRCLLPEVMHLLPESANRRAVNPLVGLDATRCRLALVEARYPSWPASKHLAGDISALPEMTTVRNILASCWKLAPEDRPSMYVLNEKLSLLADIGPWV